MGANYSEEAMALAQSLVDGGRLSVRQLQQGFEWSHRNQETLLTFLQRFCSLDSTDTSLELSEADEPRRRLFARHESRGGVWIEAVQKLVEIDMLNVSRGGLAFRSRWALEVGSEIRIGTNFQVLAIVRYCVDGGDDLATSGAEFAPRTIDHVQAIEELVASLTA